MSSLSNLFGRPRTAAITPTIPPRVDPSESKALPEGVSVYQVNKLTLNLKNAQQRYNTRRGQQELLEKQRDEALVKKSEADKKIGKYDLVQILLQKTSDYARQQAKTRIEDIVSEALNVVYGGNHKFTIDLVVRSNRPEADYYLSCDGVVTQLKPPDYGRGGGKIDVITLALRLAIIEILQVPGPLMLDESGKHLDGEAAVNLAYFLKEYSRQFNRQIVLITHNEELADAGDLGVQVTKRINKAEVKPYEIN